MKEVIEVDREQLRRFYDQKVKTEHMVEFDELQDDHALVLAGSLSFDLFVFGESVEHLKKTVLSELKKLRKKAK